MDSHIAEIRCRVTGRVQRVMYRDFVQRKARGLGIRGMAANRDDGSVLIVAQGTETDLERFIEHLHKGSFAAKVARVEVSWREPTEEFDGFKIQY